MPENSIAAHHDAKSGEQPARGFASSTVAHHRQDIGDGVALMRVGRGETGQPFREDRALAGRRFATPFPDPEPYDDRDALHRQVTEAPLIPAMLPLGDGPTGWTSRHRVALGLDNPLTFGPADRVDDHGRTGRADALLCHEQHSTPRRNPVAPITEFADDPNYGQRDSGGRPVRQQAARTRNSLMEPLTRAPSAARPCQQIATSEPGRVYMLSRRSNRVARCSEPRAEVLADRRVNLARLLLRKSGEIGRQDELGRQTIIQRIQMGGD